MDQLFQIVRAIEDSDNLSSVEDAVRSIALPLGYDRFVMFSASATRDELVERIYWVEGNWFGDGEAIDAKTYVRRCPVARHVLDTDEPFFWTKTVSARVERYRVVRFPRGTGLHGLQVPVFGRTGLEGAMSFGGNSIDGSVAARLALTIVGTSAFRVVRRLVEARDDRLQTSLSPREREVLRWTAAGRRQADIAATLGLSERTVENHLRRARLRLGAATTAQAVLAAIRSGEIEN
ncbi:PA1136 family autoinducer-binding transcriptional regulator [Reyranella sp. CPCC 100927]|uniref:PA1136 family autoinducer-binding transcriptional regulator n=1 Tax=Reyranella sp. CPCC 100927 TaxID=2599616 RepID=UPI0011B59557|nr:PA1136 family autoinducer-binding transcriptional regulator [Reyranella sp. CPCC 100927]TWT10703.1 LuxR family transcriptional regulator [Reyranella sp. CPCC 100927]